MLEAMVCSKCGDAFAVTLRTVVLPFVCSGCQKALVTFAKDLETVLQNPGVQKTLAEQGYTVDADVVADFTKQTYEDMRPAASALEACARLEPAEEFSSIENTTLLIADLEKQLAEAKQRIGYFEKTCCPELRRTTDIRDARIRVLEGELDGDVRVIELLKAVIDSLVEAHEKTQLKLNQAQWDVQEERTRKEYAQARNEMYKSEAERQKELKWAAMDVPWYVRLWEQVCDRLPESGDALRGRTNGRGPGA